jgi:type II secretory pathway pseudopilin PulG
LNKPETLGEFERSGRGPSQGGGVHASHVPATQACPACGELIHSDSLICCVCGQILQLSQGGDCAQDPLSQPRSRKALASLILGCFSFLLLPGLAAVILGHIARAEIRKSRGAPRSRGYATTGLLLGYLGLVGAPLLLALYGFPGKLRTSPASKEDSAVNSLRVLNIALQAYAATYGKGFPEKLSQLGPPQWDESLNAHASGFVARSLALGRADRYSFVYTVTSRDPDGFPLTYTITADPDQESAAEGSRHFFTDQTQAIRSEQLHPATASSPPVENAPAVSVSYPSGQ